jgi:hypothetical protein
LTAQARLIHQRASLRIYRHLHQIVQAALAGVGAKIAGRAGSQYGRAKFVGNFERLIQVNG